MKSNSSLKYHFHPRKGWLNDPNGLSYFGGKYHLFYQHLPNFEYPGKQSMHWGHATTLNFIDYTEEPIALAPDMPYDAGGVWSGTAIEKDGKLYCYYASVDKDGRQTVSVACSDDGINFKKYANNPIIREYPADGSNDFRDPAVLFYGGYTFLAIASADKTRNTGNVLLYRASDMTDFEYLGVMIEYESCRYCECPSFVHDGDKFILSVSVCPYDAPHYFEVIRGSFDGKKFCPEITSHFQKGPDEYAGQIFHAPDGRNILISWVSGWDYQPKEKCIGALSVPLEVITEGNIIRAYPIEECRHLIDGDETIKDSYITEKFVNRGEEVFITVDVE